jgi:AraC-like DNA-binding protein
VVEKSNHARRRSRSSWSGGTRRPPPGSVRSEPVASVALTVLPQKRMRLLRDEPVNTVACSTVAARFESVELSGPIPNSHQRPRIPGHAAERGVQRRSGLAAWQQIVIAAYIERHIADAIRVRALARFVYLSSCHFRRGFKRSFGIPPRRYIVQRRIERAKAPLASSACSITEIGRALGFSQRSSFSAAFRNVTGITPTEYRRTQRRLQGLADKGAWGCKARA